MDEATLRTLFVNTVLIANADGEVSAEERAFIQDFAARAGISDVKMQAWLSTVRSGEAAFEPLESPEHAEALFALLVGVASSDGSLSAAERDALLHWGHVLGLSATEVRDKARALWQHDVLGQWFAQTPASSATEDTETEDEAAEVPQAVIISNHFTKLEAMLETSPDVPVQVATMQDAPRSLNDGQVAVFHAHEEKSDTLDMLDWVRRHMNAHAVVVVLNRHQAFQISYLYEQAVDRCLVEPVYPGELAKVLRLARGD